MPERPQDRSKDRPKDRSRPSAKPGATHEQVERRTRFERARRENKPIFHQAMRYGDLGRFEIRRQTIITALEMVRKMMT